MTTTWKGSIWPKPEILHLLSTVVRSTFPHIKAYPFTVLLHHKSPMKLAVKYFQTSPFIISIDCI